MTLSIFGRFLQNFENCICHNFRKFIGNHEKTIEIFFILIYFSLQAILIYLFPKTNIALLVLIFLLSLTFERICLHIWLEEERNRVKKEGDKIREEYDKFKSLTYKEIYTLRERLDFFRKDNLKKKR